MSDSDLFHTRLKRIESESTKFLMIQYDEVSNHTRATGCLSCDIPPICVRLARLQRNIEREKTMEECSTYYMEVSQDARLPF